MKHPGPKILIFDIETSPDIITSYGLREQYHSPENILNDWFFICFGWKWLGGDKIYSYSLLDDKKRFKKNSTDDYAVVNRLHELLQDVDIIVGHNMAGFDWKKFMARVIYHGLPPIDRPYIIDTLKQARKIASFTSNKMSYLAKHLKVENKLKHAGDMWIRILRGDQEAIKEAVAYCRGDISTTEALYLRIRPYLDDHPHMGLWRGDGIDACRNCGSDDIIINGTRVTKSGKYKRYMCNQCGCWMKGKAIKIIKIK